jgi:hypothetical protein
MGHKSPNLEQKGLYLWDHRTVLDLTQQVSAEKLYLIFTQTSVCKLLGEGLVFC